jgi:hypothetical protein
MLPITIQRDQAVHEVGHLVVGLHLGINEQGIAFRTGRRDEAAQAWYRDATPQQLLLRSFAGILAHLTILPESLQAHLRDAYSHSVLLTPDHPHFGRLTAEEREFVSGARTDIELARNAAAAIHPKNPTAAETSLREAEKETRLIVAQQRLKILRVTNDIYAWASEPDRQFDPMLLYPPQRARNIIQNA